MFNSIKLWFFSLWFLLIRVPKLLKIKYTKDIQKKNKLSENFVVSYANYALKKINVKVVVEGDENLNFSNNSLYIANHGSILDPYFVISGTNKSFSFFIASEFKFLEKIPFLKHVISPMENVFINRKDLRQSISSLQKGSTNLKNNKDLFIFPEGEITHLISKEKVGEFKYGSFKTALKTQKNIVPISIIGSSKIQKKVSIFGEINSGTVKIIIHPPFLYSEFKNMSTKEISTKVNEIIKRSL